MVHGSGRFSELSQDPPIEVFELTRQFNEDSHPNKVNLGVGCTNLNMINLAISFEKISLLLFSQSLQGRFR
jgi:aspartate/tyrosine/aromatic aminotransferase